MLTFKQGITVAHVVGMRYEPPIREYGETMHTFHEDRMVNCCWVQHTFDLTDSVQECLNRKLQGESIELHPDACTCDQCAFDRLAFCGFED